MTRTEKRLGILAATMLALNIFLVLSPSGASKNADDALDALRKCSVALKESTDVTDRCIVGLKSCTRYQERMAHGDM